MKDLAILLNFHELFKVLELFRCITLNSFYMLIVSFSKSQMAGLL